MQVKHLRQALLALAVVFVCIHFSARAQVSDQSRAWADTLSYPVWEIHDQFTFITQYHPAFHAAYSGKNSLSAAADQASSLTATLFIGRRLWRNAMVYCSPEISGGKGFDDVHGIAGFPNGDIYRVNDPSPKGYIARLYVKQYFVLGSSQKKAGKDVLQPETYAPDPAQPASARQIEAIVGKLSMTDLFDDNPASHDPRTQFLNWSMMDDGAWDFPADTRGYDAILSLAYLAPRFTFRIAEALEPTQANGRKLNWHLHRSHAETIEIIYAGKCFQHHVFAGMHIYHNFTPAPIYATVINEKLTGVDTALDVIDPAATSHAKYGAGISLSEEINNRTQIFLRAGWNDGHTATWAFTEIDRSLSAGGVYQIPFARKQQMMQLGYALAVNGLSAPHRHFLEISGYGFVIGDGHLHYNTEDIAELYLLFPIHRFIAITGDIQAISHPAYNRDRGPVAVGSLRMHVSF
ncbi:MAG: carbohydrate porin [Thermoflavifilum sp.]|nr:carbohydrate porin [Thermoflavifilum sp.]